MLRECWNTLRSERAVRLIVKDVLSDPSIKAVKWWTSERQYSDAPLDPADECALNRIANRASVELISRGWVVRTAGIEVSRKRDLFTMQYEYRFYFEFV